SKVTVQISDEVSGPGEYTATATAASSGGTPDPNTANNAAQLTTNVHWPTSLPMTCSGSVTRGASITADRGSCGATAYVPSATPVTFALQPGPTFTGSLEAYVSGGGYSVISTSPQYKVSAVYEDGQLVEGQPALRF